VTACEVVLMTNWKLALKETPEIEFAELMVRLISAANPEPLITKRPNPEKDRNLVLLSQASVN